MISVRWWWRISGRPPETPIHVLEHEVASLAPYNPAYRLFASLGGDPVGVVSEVSDFLSCLYFITLSDKLKKNARVIEM